MNNILLIVLCVFIACLEWQVVDGTVTCYACKGHQCNWKSSWKKCNGDACFKRTPYLYVKINGKETVKINPSLFKDKNLNLHTNPPFHKFLNKTAFTLPNKSTTKHFFKTTTKHILNFVKSTTKPAGLFTLKTTKLATIPPAVKTTTKSLKPPTTKKPYNSYDHYKGTIKPRHRRSHEQERGCLKEKDVTHIKCHNNLCVCLKDLCNHQTKASMDGSLLIMAISLLVGSRWNLV